MPWLGTRKVLALVWTVGLENNPNERAVRYSKTVVTTLKPGNMPKLQNILVVTKHSYADSLVLPIENVPFMTP